ncbi:sensor histidine kinase [Nocardiopsis trehalosi]|uniref:sensor histidine kinase n=1 Tax=Nocardiopsis trehalosi TaxID=109329 RepID=UPI000A6B3163|nr:histidine kinase [Nocardiopsis trehalosi]
MTQRQAGPRTGDGPGPGPDPDTDLDADLVGGRLGRAAARLDAGLTRAGITRGLPRDALLAVAVAAASACVLWPVLAESPDALAVGFTPAHAGLVTALAVAQALLLCLRTTRPVLCLASTALVQVALVAVLPGGIGVRGVAPMIAAYTCGTLLPARRLVPVIAVVTVLETALGFLAAGPLTGVTAPLRPESMAEAPVPTGPAALVLDHAITGVLSYVATAVAGTYAATRRRYLELVRLRAEESVRAQRDRADAAIGAERARMARELHDIAAHHLSGMVVQAAAVERLIERDPAAARQGTAWIRAQGKETLDNLRLVVGTLREAARDAPAFGPDDGGLGGDGAPVPGLAVLDRLVGDVRDLGTPVDLVREGAPRDLPPIADVACYRVVQEALSNVRDHAPGARVRVVLSYRPDAVALEVANTPPPAGRGTPAPPRPGGRRGHGLIGMRERAQLIGAAFDAGPTADGGWRVALTLPTGTPPVDPVPEAKASGTA